jgi:hypothetical protein
MALSPNAPDYVSQVREIIGDLRDNYLKKQQLFQQDEQAKAQVGLGYAQLAAQRENSARQAQLESQRIQAASIDNERQLEQYRSGLGQKSFENELAYGKFQLDQQKELDKLEEKRILEEKDKTAGALEQKFRVAQLSGDPARISAAMEDISNANIDRLQRTAIYDNVYGGIQKNRELAQAEQNLKTATPARALGDRLNLLNPRDYTPDQYVAEVDKVDNEFRALNNTDPRVNEPFSKIRMDAMSKLEKYRQSEIGQMMDSFEDLAEQGRLDPEYQKQYDDLKSNPAKYTTKAVQGLAFKRNKANSIAELEAIDRRFAGISENLITQNPGLSITKTDPQTGESYRTFTYESPDLTPREGYNATIDPDTGLLTKAAQDRIKKWEDEVTSPNFLYGQVPLIRQFQTQQLQAGAPATAPTDKAKKETTQAAALPFRTKSSFEGARPGTTTIPVASKNKPTQISDSTLATIAEAYRRDPNAVVYGRPAREILATLKARGYTIPGVDLPSSVVSPGAVEDSGQNR